jgi:hypothetical protein
MNPSLRSMVSSVCALHGARRIVCIGRGREPLCLSLREAGYAAWGMDPSGRCDTDPAEPGPASWAGATGMDPGLQPAAIRFDVVISTESPEPFAALDERVALAARALRPGGLFLLPIPYRRSLASRVVALYDRWRLRRSRERGEPSWSKQRLQGLLESQGFVLAEVIGMRDGSGQWTVIVWVARQGGRLPATCDG